MIQIKPVIKVIGVLLIIIGVLMFSGIGFSLYFGSNDAPALLISGLLTCGAGLMMWWFNHGTATNIKKREGYLIVALGWLAMSLFAMLPYLVSETIPTITNAFFESVSGLTTTGASIITDIEALPHGILYWRSLTQWIGGMGIIVLTVALLPLLGVGGVELFVAEAPGPTSDKIHPRIRETAKRLWFIYVSLTAALTLLLKWAGMSFYDALNHALTTLATGGFSTKNASLMAFDDPLIQYPIVVFMFLAGTNYTVLYFALKGNFRRVWYSDEFKTYFLLLFILIIGVTASIYYMSPDLGMEKSFRNASFMVVSVLTTTGFVSADYTSWGTPLMMVFFILMFVGACAGSTSGGIKIIRNLVFFKNTFLEFKRLLHPRGMIRMKIDKQLVAARVMTHILVFLLIYMMLFVFGSITVAIMGMDFLSSIGAVATSLGNVGPGIGSVGPMDNFAAVPTAAKWVLAFMMLLGRLELFSILILFTPYFWKSN